MKRTAAFLFLICSVMMLFGCSAGKDKKETVPEISGTVSCDTKYMTAVISLSLEEAEAAGLSLGDSCDVEFENGYALNDIPFYNGYYVKTGEPLVVAYQGFANIQITYNNAGIWDQADLEEGMSVTIRLNGKGKYAAIQESLGQQYSLDRTEYESDEQFVNFRELSGGSLLPDMFYRGASPADNSRGRAEYADGLLETYGINLVIDLADTDDDMHGYMSEEGFSSVYLKSLYDRERVVLLGMSSSYQSEDYRMKLAEGLRRILSSEDCRVYIHCMEGKDRTGFVCMILEALAGADYGEMLRDYMITYYNYYRVSEEETPEKYGAIADLYFNTFMEYLHGSADPEELKDADLASDAADYLLSCGMSQEEIDGLIFRLTGEK